ncbi:hypothetical protein ACN47E_001527 [Coniothyrium glycines]
MLGVWCIIPALTISHNRPTSMLTPRHTLDSIYIQLWGFFHICYQHIGDRTSKLRFNSYDEAHLHRPAR